MASPSSPAWGQFPPLDTSSLREFDQVLHGILYGEEYKKHAQDLNKSDLVWLVDYLDKALNRLDPTGETYRKTLRELRTICGDYRILPTSYSPPPQSLKIEIDPFGRGGLGVVYKATFENTTVCVKRIIVYEKDGPQKACKVLCKEAVMWKHLNHPNVLSLLWVTLDPLQLLSDWMPGGELPEYTRNHPDVSRVELLSDVANGLCYIHERNVIHGDLKGSNVLVDGSGRARIADFGHTTVTRNLDSAVPVSCHPSTVRYNALEVLKGEGHSKSTDMYSFAMVMFEAFTGTVPFSEKRDIEIYALLASSERPKRPDHSAVTYQLWKLMQNCWDDNPKLRPDAPKVAEFFLSILDSGPGTLGQLRDLDPSSPNFADQLDGLLYGDQYEQSVATLGRDKITLLTDYLDDALNHLNPSCATFRKCLRELRSICGDNKILPSSCSLKPPNLTMDLEPFARGELSIAYKATLENRMVCVSRFEGVWGERVIEFLCKGAAIWKHLKHPNILPLLGATLDPPQLILDWMPGGKIRDYIKSHTDVNRVALLSDIANGLRYLHSRNVVHGDLKGSSVLVDSSGRARIADFMFTTVTQNPISAVPLSYNTSSLRHCALEVLKGEGGSKKSDIYSFAMVMFEVLADELPFAGRRDIEIYALLAGGSRPTRPDHSAFTPRLWKLTQKCWDNDPNVRPEASDIVEVISNTPNCGIKTWDRFRDLDASSGNSGDKLPEASEQDQPQSTNPPSDGPIYTDLFFDSDGDPLAIYVDEDIQDRDTIVELIKSYGGIVSQSHGDVKHILDHS